MPRLEDIIDQHAQAAHEQQYRAAGGTGMAGQGVAESALAQRLGASEPYRERTVLDQLNLVAKKSQAQVDACDQLRRALPDEVLNLPLSVLHRIL